LGVDDSAFQVQSANDVPTRFDLFALFGQERVDDFTEVIQAFSFRVLELAKQFGLAFLIGQCLENSKDHMAGALDIIDVFRSLSRGKLESQHFDNF